MDLIGLYRMSHPNEAGCTFFSSTHEPLSRIFQILVCKTNFSKFREFKIISSLFSNHNEMKVEIKHNKKTRKFINMCILKNMLLDSDWVNEEIKGEIKNCLKTSENKNLTYQNLWKAATSILRGKYIAMQAYLEKKNIYISDNLNLPLKEPEKEEQNSKWIKQRKLNIKPEIN